MTSKTPEPVLITMSVLAGLQTFFAGSTATTVVVEADRLLTAIFAFGALAVGAAQFGLQFYVRGRVVPLEAVSERVVNGVVVAGPANDIINEGTTVREVGDVPETEKELARIVDDMRQGRIAERAAAAQPVLGVDYSVPEDDGPLL